MIPSVASVRVGPKGLRVGGILNIGVEGPSKQGKGKGLNRYCCGCCWGRLPSARSLRCLDSKGSDGWTIFWKRSYIRKKTFESMRWYQDSIDIRQDAYDHQRETAG